MGVCNLSFWFIATFFAMRLINFTTISSAYITFGIFGLYAIVTFSSWIYSAFPSKDLQEQKRAPVPQSHEFAD